MQAKSNMYSPKRPALPSLEGVVGACKRGRRKGRRNKTSAERASEAIIDQKRVEKNAREKVRVKNVNHGFELLRRAIGQKRTGKNPTKLATLEAAIKYIHELRAELGEIPLYANTPGILMDDSYKFSAASTSGEVDMTENYIQWYTGDIFELSLGQEIATSDLTLMTLPCDDDLLDQR